jgi:hypothetical protein
MVSTAPRLTAEVPVAGYSDAWARATSETARLVLVASACAAVQPSADATQSVLPLGATTWSAQVGATSSQG